MCIAGEHVETIKDKLREVLEIHDMETWLSWCKHFYWVIKIQDIEQIDVESQHDRWLSNIKKKDKN